MKKKILPMAFLALMLMLSACNGTSELSQNHKKWNEAGIRNYTFDLVVSCFCPFADIMPVAVEVKDGQVVSMTDVNGNALDEKFVQYFEEAASMDRLFDIAKTSLSKADEVQITYDAQYGFPAAINADFIKMAMDDEISYYVNNFRPLP